MIIAQPSILGGIISNNYACSQFLGTFYPSHVPLIVLSTHASSMLLCDKRPILQNVGCMPELQRSVITEELYSESLADTT